MDIKGVYRTSNTNDELARQAIEPELKPSVPRAAYSKALDSC